MQLASLSNNGHDPTPDHTTNEQVAIDRLVANYIKWYEPDDSILVLAGLEGVLFVINKSHSKAQCPIFQNC